MIEGKLRLNYDPHGVEQVLRSRSLLEAALRPKRETEVAADARFWRQAILNAIYSVGNNAVVSFGAQEALGDRESRLSPKDLADLVSVCYSISCL